MSNLTATRLAELDETFLGWLPGLLGKHGERVRRARESHLAAPADALAVRVLPASVVRRALLIESLGARRAALLDDVDGMGPLLAGVEVVTSGADVAVLGFGGLAGARAAADGARVDGAIAGGTEAMGAAAGGGRGAALLGRFGQAMAALAPGGRLVVRVRAPWDPLLVELTEKLALVHEGYVRDVEHRVLATGHVIDGGGDLVVLRPSADSAARLAALDPATLALPPYFWFDLDGLDEARLAAGGLDQLFVAVQELLGCAPAVVQRHGGAPREIGAWYAESGVGLTAEINREWAHLLVGLMPYDEQVESAALHAALTIFGGPGTRARPRRTERSPGYAIFA